MSLVGTEETSKLTIGLSFSVSLFFNSLGRDMTIWGEDQEKGQATPSEVTQFVTADGRNEYGKITQIDVGNVHTLFLSLTGNVYFCGGLKDGDSFMASPPDPHFVRRGEPPEEPPYDKDNYVKQPDTYGIAKTRATPIHVKALKNIIAVFSGGSFCAALDRDRQLWTFGFGNSGELARSPGMVAPKDDGSYNLQPEAYKNKKADSYGWFNMKLIHDKFITPHPVQFQMPGKKRVMNVACGDIHMLVAAADAGSDLVRLYSAGHNNYGQLGVGDQKGRHVLTLVPFFDEKRIVGQIAAGNFSSYALTAVGDALYSWGRSDQGQCGIMDTDSSSYGGFFVTPQRVPLPHGKVFKSVTSGESAGFVLSMDDELYSWGFEGVTGHGGKYLTEDCPTPRKINIPGVSRIHAVDGGSQHGILLATVDVSGYTTDEEDNDAKPQTKKQRRA